MQKRTRSDVLFGLTNLMDEARTAPERLPPALPKLLFAYGAKGPGESRPGRRKR